MAPDLRALSVLSQHRVPFVVIGGHAVNVHGVLRATEDTDVVWLRSRESEGNLLRALVEIDAHSIGNEIDPATGIEKIYPVTESFVRAGGLMMLCTNAGFLDLFDSIPGFPHEPARTVWESAFEIDRLRVASLDGIRNMKHASGLQKDLRALTRGRSGRNYVGSFSIRVQEAMTPVVNIHEAKTHLSRLIDQVAAGREVIIAKAGRKVARLVPLDNGVRPKKLGGLKGRLKVPDDFNAAIDDSVVAAFEGRSTAQQTSIDRAAKHQQKSPSCWDIASSPPHATQASMPPLLSAKLSQGRPST